MTFRDLECDWLSLRCWLNRCVLPSAMALVLALLSFRLITQNPSTLNHNALIVGFFTLYFILIRGGHLLMIRALHSELKAKYKDQYAKKLAAVPRGNMRSHNLGFTLTRIKRELLDASGR